MNKLELLQKVLAKKETRIAYLEHDFYNFFLYYFRKHIKFPKMAPFHKEWCDDATQGLNLYVEGSRWFAKSTILWMALEIWKICYKKCNFICNLCYDKKKAKAFNKMIVKELLQNKDLTTDFGVLFSMKKADYNEDDISEKWMDEFVTTNWIKIKAFWMGEPLRWEVHNSRDKWNVRPDYLNIDDIDNNKNTKNKRIILEDMDHLYTEVLWGLEEKKYQVIWLWNVIRKDWRNPRGKENFKNNDEWKIYSNFIYWKAWVTSGDIQWGRYVETEKEAIEKNKDSNIEFLSLEKIKKKLKSWFNQNYLGIALVKGQSVIKDERIIYNTELTEFDFFQIGLDPAFSKKTWTDPFWIVVTWFKKIKDTMYKKPVFCKKLEWEKKDTLTAINIIKSLYVKYNAKMIVIEWNNWWQQFWDLLKGEWLAVDIVTSSKDKITYVMEHEGDLMRWLIYFSPDVSELVDQLLEFTGEDWEEDDLVDWFIRSLKYTEKEFYTW